MFRSTGENNVKDEFFAFLKQDTSGFVNCSDRGITSDDLVPLANIMKEKQLVSELCMDCLNLGIDEIDSLKQIILNTRNLKKITLRCNNLGNAGLASIIFDPKLQSIIPKVDFDFSANDITIEGLVMAKLAAENRILSPSSLLTLLSGNPIDDESFVDECREFAKLLKSRSSSPEATVTSHSSSPTKMRNNLFASSQEEKEQVLPVDFKKQLDVIRDKLDQEKQLLDATVQYISRGQASVLPVSPKYVK